MLITPIEFREAAKMAMGSLRANKFRSALTILGVLVGVAAVIALASAIDGLNLAVDEEINSFGTNIINVSKYAHNTDWDNLSEDERNRDPITVNEAIAIMEHCPSVEAVAPQNYYWAPGGNKAKFKNRIFENPNFMGTWPDYVRVKDKNLKAGRFFTPTDEQFRLMVCVIGSDVAQGLFETEDPVGQEIRLNGDRFEVVGVFEEVESNFGNSFENRHVVIPLSTYQKLVPWEKELGLVVRAKSYELIEEAKEEIINALRVERQVPPNKPNNFALATQDQFRDEFSDISAWLYIAMLVITSVSLAVGGIGVMNIMLVSVTERTREIGVRKAIGAKRSNILMQFLAEAISLAGVGGILGIIIGILSGFGLNSLLGFPVNLPVFWVFLGFAVSVSVGLVSGMYPAYKASRLDPIEALRYE